MAIIYHQDQISELPLLEVRKTADQTLTASYVDITSWTTPGVEDSAFSFNTSTGVVTINEDGRYLVTYNYNIYSTGTRCVCFVGLQQDTGGGYAVASEDAIAYSRGTASPDNLYYASAGQCVVVDATNGDLLKLVTKKEGDAGDLIDAELHIVKLEGTKGDTGATGPAATIHHTIGITVDGGGSVVTTGNKGARQVNFSGTLVGVTLLANATGSVEFEILKNTYASYPSASSSIVGTNKPEIVSAQKASITLDGGWTTSISAGDILRFAITGTPATITQVSIFLHYDE